MIPGATAQVHTPRPPAVAVCGRRGVCATARGFQGGACWRGGGWQRGPTRVDLKNCRGADHVAERGAAHGVHFSQRAADRGRCSAGGSGARKWYDGGGGGGVSVAGVPAAHWGAVCAAEHVGSERGGVAVAVGAAAPVICRLCVEEPVLREGHAYTLQTV
eukprot:ctg_193.g87